MLEQAKRDGVTRLVASTHFSPAAAEAYRDVFARAAARAAEAGIELLPGMEYDFDRLPTVEDQPLRTIGESRFVLVDLHQGYLPPGWEGLFFRLKLKGYRVLAAHPERLFQRTDGREVGQLAAAGVYFQINAGSLFGRYGRRARETAFRMIAAGHCHVFGSDAHRAGDFRLSEACELLRKRFGVRPAEGWFEINPERILSDREPLTFRPPPGWRERLRRWFDRKLGR